MIFKNDLIITHWKESSVLSPNMGDNTAKFKADIAIFEGIMVKTWSKEDELQFKSELAGFDRKIEYWNANTHQLLHVCDGLSPKYSITLHTCVVSRLYWIAVLSDEF